MRDVLRLKSGAGVEVFDDAGNVAQGTIERCDEQGVTVQTGQVQAGSLQGQIVVASAVPKGDRADWMIEKLSELGVARFIPLKTARSVVHPEGRGKLERWQRIATESAKQSHRSGVMQIDELTPLKAAIEQAKDLPGVFLSTEPDAAPILSVSKLQSSSCFLFIGPEGGWTAGEIEQFQQAGLTGAKLTKTILRVESAAVAAAVVACLKSADHS